MTMTYTKMEEIIGEETFKDVVWFLIIDIAEQRIMDFKIRCGNIAKFTEISNLRVFLKEFIKWTNWGTIKVEHQNIKLINLIKILNH